MSGLRRRRRTYSRPLPEHMKPNKQYGQDPEQHRDGNMGTWHLWYPADCYLILGKQLALLCPNIYVWTFNWCAQLLMWQQGLAKVLTQTWKQSCVLDTVSQQPLLWLLKIGDTTKGVYVSLSFPVTLVDACSNTDIYISSCCRTLNANGRKWLVTRNMLQASAKMFIYWLWFCIKEERNSLFIDVSCCISGPIEMKGSHRWSTTTIVAWMSLM